MGSSHILRAVIYDCGPQVGRCDAVGAPGWELVCGIQTCPALCGGMELLDSQVRITHKRIQYPKVARNCSGWKGAFQKTGDLLMLCVGAGLRPAPTDP